MAGTSTLSGQSGYFEVRHFTGQAVQEGRDIGDGFIFELTVQHLATHDGNRFFQRFGGAVVHVRIGDGHVTQGGCAELVHVRVVTGDVIATHVGGTGDLNRPEVAVSQGRTTVTSDTAVIGEGHHAVF